MAEVAANAEVDVDGGRHVIELRCDTVDNRFHVGAFYELTATFREFDLPCSSCGYAVEWTRSAFKSKWALHRGSSALTPGRYVFCPPGTPFLDHWHNLGSRDWTSDERDPWPALGEWAGPRQWDSGTFVPPYPRGKPIGFQPCFVEGEAITFPTTPTPYVRGFPASCYGDEVPFVDITGKPFLATVATAIQLHYAADPAALTTLQQATGSPAAVIDYPLGNPLIPGGMIQITTRATFIALDGTPDELTFALQAALIQLPPTDFGPFSTLPSWHLAAVEWQNRIFAAGVPATLPVVLCGHSMGGVVCQILAARYQLFQPERLVFVVSYGAPVAGDVRLRDAIESGRTLALANQGDWVPLFPSRFGLGWPVLWNISPALALAWNAWERVRVLQVIAEDGTIVPSDNPPISFADLYEIAFRLSQGDLIAPFDAHLISTYAGRLS